MCKSVLRSCLNICMFSIKASCTEIQKKEKISYRIFLKYAIYNIVVRISHTVVKISHTVV